MTDLDEQLKRATKHRMTPEGLWQQRVSFVSGQTDLPREEVERHLREHYGTSQEDHDR